jgi:predicted membrane protein
MNESTNFNDEGSTRSERWKNRMERHGSGDGHIWTGLFLLAIGGLALARSMGVPMPPWLFTWQMLLIAIGLFIGFKKGFRDGGWFVPVIIGGFFMINEFALGGDLRRHIWPMILIVVGAFFIFRPRHKHCVPWEKKNTAIASPGTETVMPLANSFMQDDIIDSTNIFSGTKKVILSKNFKGGDVVNIFGGCEIDLTQADMTSPAVLEVTAIFGGATLIVPSNWAIKSEAVTIFGGIGDKRKITTLADSAPKTLVLKGTMIFGGMEIRSY